MRKLEIHSKLILFFVEKKSSFWYKIVILKIVGTECEPHKAGESR